HGWNFLGDIIDENLEYERIIRDKALLPADMVTKAEAEYDKKVDEAKQQKEFYEQQLQVISEADKTLEEYFKKDDYTLDEVKSIEPGENQELARAQQIAVQVISNYEGFENVQKLLTGEIEKTIETLNGKSLTTNYREDALPGNNPYLYTPGEVWGNNDYDGPDPKKEDAFHGTHVAGIIASERNNGLGVNGVASNAKIMVLRAVSTGDEYDKDVAAAIRYAADNGAKIINTSFGKYHSTNPEWVWDAIKYAASKDVLIVNAAGNEGITTDETQVYPQDQEGTGSEISDNFLTVGALAPKYGADMIASFSNYGKSTVDVFAPGVQIYSTAPLNKYRNASGTSMASPATAGVAAVIRSHFPKLTAAQVKQIIMDSGLTTIANVNVGDGSSKAFAEISKSGKMVNLYNALIMASKMK
ncbi:MAG: S8 family serine peptidase, partial [Bacteroidota bacterium]